MIRTTGRTALDRQLIAIGKRTTPEVAAEYQRSVGIGLLNDLVRTTFVNIGQAKAGWAVGINAPAATNPNPAPDPSGQRTIGQGIRSISRAAPFSRINIANATVQSIVGDRGLFDPPNPGPSKDKRPGREGKILVSGGYSTQNPEGIVRGPMVRAVVNARRAAQAVRREFRP